MNDAPPIAVTLPAQLQVMIKDKLANDEVVLWYEQPEPNIFSLRLNPKSQLRALSIIGYGLLALQLFMVFVLDVRNSSTLYLQFFTPLILIAGPYIRTAIAKRRATTIHYIVTTRQGFIIENLKIKVLTRQDAADMDVVPEQAGFTSLTFKRSTGWLSVFFSFLPVGFVGIANATEVKQNILRYWR